MRAAIVGRSGRVRLEDKASRLQGRRNTVEAHILFEVSSFACVVGFFQDGTAVMAGMVPDTKRKSDERAVVHMDVG